MSEGPSAALHALQEVDFEWAVHLRSVWTDIAYDIPAIHGGEREAILSRIEALRRSSQPRSPLGLVIRGNAGAGKTHMLSAIRRSVLSQAQIFVLVDMTDVRDFWETVNQGYLASLEQSTPKGETQLSLVLRGVLRSVASPLSLERITDRSQPSWASDLSGLLRDLAQHDRQGTRRHADVLRAACLLGADDFEISGIAYNWLLGIALDDQDFRRIGFARPCCTPLEAVEGLSWLIGLSHGTVLALDQLDSIVTQHSLVSSVEQDDSDEQKLSRSIIESIGGGLSALRDRTCRTLTLVTCIEKTWERLTSLALSSFTDRFEAASISLANLYDGHSAAAMVAHRLRPAYLKHGVDPPYSSWPYAPQFFVHAEGMLPRQLLKHCDQHRRRCLESGEIRELTALAPDAAAPPSPSQQRLDQDYEELTAHCSTPPLHDDKQEDGSLALLIRFAVCGLLHEQDPGDALDHEVDTDFTGGSRTRPLHARIRQILRSHGDDERHLSLRVLLSTHARAYNNRLQLAMGASGIARGLHHRHLLILRPSPAPTGPTSQRLTQAFQMAGGEFVSITDDDLRRIEGLRLLKERHPAEFEAWQARRQPLSQLQVLRPVIDWLRLRAPAPSNPPPTLPPSDTAAGSGARSAAWPGQPPPPPPPRAAPAATAANAAAAAGEANRFPPEVPGPPAGAEGARAQAGQEARGSIPIGQPWSGRLPEAAAVTLAREDLSRHTVILAGSGSGKTVLIRRLVEEAALQGIPAIVIDGANDLARLGDRWEPPPQAWREGDREKAELYHRRSEVILWTPGRESGNPLQLNPLPDFAAIDDPEERDQATDMARDALQDIVAPGHSQAALLKRGILKAALNGFATSSRRGDLHAFIDLLRHLPAEACDGIATAEKKAQEMAGILWAEVQNNPLLRQSGHSLDPAILLGSGHRLGRTRISVVNLSGLQGLAAQRQFLNQLFMTLFTWIRKNPPPPEVALRGLLVLDEARDFVPAREATACKASFNRLVAQARKYGLGIVVATQAPKSIDHNVIANCSTQLFGKANSPASIAVVAEAVAQRGGQPDAVSQLKTGQFYLSSETISPPLRIRTPLCLSYHPAAPLSEEEVMHRAAMSRVALIQAGR